jgi:helicase
MVCSAVSTESKKSDEACPYRWPEWDYTTSVTPAQQAVLDRDLLNSGFHCILQMPTGSGKTWLAEQAIGHTLDQGQRTIYVTPLRALADELCDRWKQRFAPHSVGVFTGDYASGQYPVSFQDAKLLVMTPEKLDACTRHWRSHWNWLPTVDLIVVDEFHLLGDPNRGPRLEGALLRMLRLNPFLRILGLSATLGNRVELSNWLGGVEYASNHRPIPLQWSTVHYKKADDKPNLLLREVQRNLAQGGKSLVFVQSRRRAEALAKQLQNAGLRVTHHHAGLDHRARRQVEGVFRSGQLDALVATATLEMGLNLPVRQVILYDLQGFDGQDFVPLPVNSVWQRAGRAGRPGLDEVGEVVLMAPVWGQVGHYPHGQFEPLVSGLNQPAALAEQIVTEVACGLSCTETQLEANFSHSLAAQQGRLPSIRQMVDEMVSAGMLATVEDGHRVLLRATRLGHVAVRHMLRPQTVLLFRRVLEQHPQLTLLDLLLLAASSSDCQPLIPVDFEQLDDLAEALAEEPSVLLSLPETNLAQWLGIGGKRLLAAIHTALVGRTWTRTGDGAITADTHGCYAFDVERLHDSLQRLLAAMVDLWSVSQAEELPPSEGPSLLERIRVLEKMVACGLDEQSVTLTLVPGLGAKLARQLKEAGIQDVEDLALADPSDLLAVPGIGPKRATSWITAAEDMVDGHLSAFRYREEATDNRVQRSNWPPDIDPYRLRRALDLKVVGQDGNLFRVVGGLDPHLVWFHQGGFVCDCPDSKRHTCKHILQVRLFRGDAQLRRLADSLATETSSDTLDIHSLWWRGNR